jgi:hypothetical protein
MKEAKAMAKRLGTWVERMQARHNTIHCVSVLNSQGAGSLLFFATHTLG